jgi:Fe-S-cluster formation regulator IscX/YfhJ
VIIVDRLLVGGIRFVLDKIVTAVDREMNDDSRLRERLLEAQMRAELGEIDESELAVIERDVVQRLREIQEARGETGMSMDPNTMRIAGIEATFVGDEHDDDPGEQQR